MGTAESTQSSELGAIAGLTNQSSFHQQSPNVARLIKSETSSKMEYEFPISDISSANPSHPHGGGNLSSNHSIIPSNNTRFAHSNLHQTNSLNSSTTFNHSGSYLSSPDQRNSSKTSPHQTSNLWSSLTSCFGCRTRGSNDSSMNPLRDKVHAIRIVRASNDLTPAVFDSHYNIITLEQLRECDNNGSGNINSAANDFSEPLTSVNPNSNASAQNGNGSVIVSSSTTTTTTTTASTASTAGGGGGGKKDTSHRMKKKKKKRATTATYSSKPTGTDDEDDEEESGRT